MMDWSDGGQPSDIVSKVDVKKDDNYQIGMKRPCGIEKNTESVVLKSC